MTIRSVTVTAQWALWGKTTNDRGYRLLEHSRGLVSPDNFTEVITRFSPGTLDRLPQVTFSWLTNRRDIDHRAIAIHDDDAARLDADGRRIVFTRFFCVPHTELAADAVSYREMHEGIGDIELPPAGREPLKVPLPASARHRRPNEHAPLVAASLLTGKPVIILRADQTLMTERLAFIDDVMALLPYGMRSRMSAATWTSGTVRAHKFRLTFQDAARGNNDDQIVYWDRLEDTPIGHPQAQEYLDWLRDTDDAVARLAGLTEPMGFGSEDVRTLLKHVIRRWRRDDERQQQPEPEKLGGHVFISYVREDAHHVDRMQRELERAGIRVWRDTADLWPGENWRVRIRRAIQDEALVFIACFSARSLAKAKSYQNAELALAIEQLQLRPPDDPWLIPVRFGECDIPDRDIGAGHTLASIQHADLFGEREAEGTARLVEAVLRILRRNGEATALPAVDTGPDPLARALAEEGTTREQVLAFFARPAPEADKAWNATTETRRDEALIQLLAQPDEAVSRALAAHWEVVGPDAERLIGRQLAAGQTSEAALCLDALGSADRHDDEDRLLSDVLLLAKGKSDDSPRYTMAVVNLLRSRPVPARDTFRSSCEVLRWGNRTGWQANLVCLLLINEPPSPAPGPSRTAGWLDWLCLSEPAPGEERPDWVAGLSPLLSQSPGSRALKGLQALMVTNSAWAAVILKVAREVQRLREVLAVADLGLADVVAREISSPKKPGRGWGAVILYALDVDLWQQDVPPRHIAAADVVRILFGGKPAHVPAATVDGYAAGLGEVLALDAMEPLRASVGQRILASAVGKGRPSASAIELFNKAAEEDSLRPALVEFMVALSDDRRPYDRRLTPAFWAAMTTEPRLHGYASADRLLAAAREAAQDPEAALRRVTDTFGRSNTDLALACYTARTLGLPVQEILRVLSEAEISRVPARVLDGVLREFQALLYFGSGDAESRTAAEQDLFGCYEQIAAGALGSDYGRAFIEHMTMRLRDEAEQRDRLLSVMQSDRLPSVERRDRPPSVTQQRRARPVLWRKR